MKSSSWFDLVLLSCLWGCAYPLGKIAIETAGPLTVSAGRVGIAALVLSLVVRLRHDPLPRTWFEWRFFVAVGVLNSVIPYCLILWGMTRIASGVAATITAMTPVITLVAGHYLFASERMDVRRVVSVGIGMAGIAVIVGSDPATLASGDIVARLAVLGATISSALSYVVAARFLQGGPSISAPVASWGQMCSATLVLLPVSLVVDRPWKAATWAPGTTLAILGLAIPCTVVAYLLFYRLSAGAGAANTSLVTLLAPIVSLTLGMIALSEQPRAYHLVGMALVGLALVGTDGRVVQALFMKARPVGIHHPRPRVARSTPPMK